MMLHKLQWFKISVARMYWHKYRKRYCSHPGVSFGVSVGVAQMLKFLVKVFKSLYLLNNQVDLCMLVDIGLKIYSVPSRYTWVTCDFISCDFFSKAFFALHFSCDFFCPPGDLEVKVMEILVKVFVNLYLLNVLMDQVGILHIHRY